MLRLLLVVMVLSMGLEVSVEVSLLNHRRFGLRAEPVLLEERRLLLLLGEG